MATVTNIVVASANRGEHVKVTLSSTDATNNIKNFTLGQKCTITSSSKVGYISRIDALGISFWMRPNTIHDRMDSSSTTGLLALNETITVQ